MPDERVAEECREHGCAKIKGDGTCLAFLDPKFQWRNGRCFGLADKKTLGRVKREMQDYAYKKSADRSSS